MTHLLPVWTGAAHLLLAVAEHHLLEGLGDREADLLARRDLDRLAGLRVAPRARLHLAQAEDAETRDLDRLALLHGLDHGIDHRREDLIDVLSARPGAFGELRHQLRLRHQHLLGGWGSGANLRHPTCGCQENPRLPRTPRARGSARCVRAGGGGEAAVSASLRRLGRVPGCAGVRPRGAATAAPPPSPAGRHVPACGDDSSPSNARSPTPLPAAVRRRVVQRRGGCPRGRAIMQTCKSGTCRSAGAPVDIPEESWGSVALELHRRQPPPGQAVQEIGTSTDGVRDRLERILASYEEMDRRFSAAGGLGSLLNLYEQVRRELERVSFEELDRMTLEIKTVIEALLKMDYELRKVHNLKLAFETRPPGAGALG